MTLSNEQLMWLSLGIWVTMILLLAYYAFKPKTQAALPSGNTADPGVMSS